MRFKLIIFALSFSVLFGCVAYKYSSPYQRFGHETHEKIIAEKQKDCFACHNVVIDEKDPAKKLEILKETLKGAEDKKFIGGTCHECHKDFGTKLAEAPSRCGTCHETMKNILPDNHKGVWVKEHNVAAKSVSANCTECHERWFCSDCHTDRNLVRVKNHTRTFKSAHVVAASADPASCSSCHRSSFCADCHAKR